jgi:intron-binding protein aquarius
MLGDHNQFPPIVKRNIFRTFSNFDNSLFTRLIKNKVNHIYLEQQGRGRKEIVDIYRWKYPLLKDIKMINEKNNSGFLYNVQFINVDEFEGKGECLNSDYSYYNLAEAEYSIGIFMYMCLIGYDPKKISIITSYNGQKDLIKEIYNKKCFWNNIFSGIKKICTIDKYQGQQNDYIILSLVRTVDIGYLRDIRRLIVSLSRARLGLYILGKWDLFNNEKDIENCFRYFKNQEKNLKIYLDNNTNNIITIEDFKHMFRIVQELLKIKFS